MQRCRTFTIPKSEIDFMVTEFLCHDSNMMQALGAHNKVFTWKVVVSGRSQPIEIQLHVERGLVASVLGGAEVTLLADSQRLFPLTLGAEKERLTEDLTHHWGFRGTLKGLNMPDFAEVRPPLAPGHSMDQWYPATLTRQREDGHFEVMVRIPDAKGRVQSVCYPAVPAKDIRERSSGRPLLLPHRSLDLRVPKRDPLAATLSVDGLELITHYFARHSPQSAVQMRVDKGRSTVEVGVGHSILSHFLSREVRRVHIQKGHNKVAWTIQVNPFIEHMVELERHSNWSRIFTLSIDGRRLVESSAADIDCAEGGTWHCDFRFLGESSLDFEVFETDRRVLEELDSTSVVSQLTRFTCDCAVTIEDERDLSSASFSIDGVDFGQLAAKAQAHPEPKLITSVEVMQQQYGVIVPFKVKETNAPPPAPTSGFASLSSAWRCCSKPVSVSEENEQIIVSSPAAKNAGA